MTTSEKIDNFIFGLLCVAVFGVAGVLLLPASIAAGSLPGAALGAACIVAAVGFFILGARRALGH